MSYFVIKGPDDCGQYLCDIFGHECPQWYSRKTARHFPDAESAWKYLRATQQAHPDSTYTGRVIRVMTRGDQRARLARLQADLEYFRRENQRLREDNLNLRSSLNRLGVQGAGIGGD